MADPPEFVIDLGAPRPDRPGARRRIRGWWRRRRQLASSGLVITLVLALVSGSAAPLPAQVSIPLPPPGEGEFDVIGDLAFVAESRTRWLEPAR